jgi:exodeoxyribonuclease V beta subunit
VLTGTNAQAAAMAERAPRSSRSERALQQRKYLHLAGSAGAARHRSPPSCSRAAKESCAPRIATDALGRTGNDLDELSRDDLAWEAELLRFQQHHEIWRDRGFIQMLRHLAATHRVRQRLLSYPMANGA